MDYDVQYYINHPNELKKFVDGIIDDELTRGRIRTIAVKMRYGSSSARELAEYYDLPVRVINDIGNGKLFGEITKDILEVEQ